MKLLAKSAKIIQPGHEMHGKTRDILLEGGKITAISESISPSDELNIIESNDLHVSTGWLDMRVDYTDPGNEHREDLSSGATASSYGGFTGVGLLPDTTPCVDNKSGIEYILARNKRELTRIYPYAAISKGRRGGELTEMIDLANAGAIAFTDGNLLLESASLLKKALLYSRSFNGLIITHSEEHSLAADGQINEGVVNVQLGMTGVPAIAEEIAVARDIDICRYTGGRLHFSKVSSAKALTLVKNAKSEGLPVTADVGVYHLLLDEHAMMDYDQNLKLVPPLRTREDREALIEGVLDGSIDAIVSDHLPVEEEKKKCEFQLAAPGAIATQLVYPMLLKVFSPEDLHNRVLKTIHTHPYQILNIPHPILRKGEKANLTFFDPTLNWSLDAKTNKSKSRNTPFWEKGFTGRAVAIANRGKVKILG